MRPAKPRSAWTANTWTCPRCNSERRPRLVRIRFSIGPIDYKPQSVCDDCVDELLQEECDYTVRGDFLHARPVWAIKIVDIGGEVSAPNKAQDTAAASVPIVSRGGLGVEPAVMTERESGGRPSLSVHDEGRLQPSAQVDQSELARRKNR